MTWHEVRIAGHASHIARAAPHEYIGYANATGPIWLALCGRRIHTPDQVTNLHAPRLDQPGLPCGVTCKACRQRYPHHG